MNQRQDADIVKISQDALTKNGLRAKPMALSLDDVQFHSLYALLALFSLLLVLPAQASQADSDRSSDAYCGQDIGSNMQSLSIWDVIFDNERLLLKDQGLLWNHLLVFGLAQLISMFMFAVQIEHLRQRIEAHERELSFSHCGF